MAPVDGSSAFTLSDDLVVLVRQRDEHAFEQLVRVSFTPLWRFAKGLTGSGESAQDVVQDVYCRIWLLGTKWHPTGPVRSYLYASVRNAAITLRHRAVRAEQYRTRALTLASADDRLAVLHGGIDDRDDRLEVIRTEIAHLSERQQSALRLRFEEALTVPEIAQVLGMSGKGAENLLMRAIRRLKERVGVTATTSVTPVAPPAAIRTPLRAHRGV